MFIHPEKLPDAGRAEALASVHESERSRRAGAPLWTIRASIRRDVRTPAFPGAKQACTRGHLLEMSPGATALALLHAAHETAILALSGRARVRYGEGLSQERSLVIPPARAFAPTRDASLSERVLQTLLGTTRASTDADLRRPGFPRRNQVCTRGPPALVLVVWSGRLVAFR